MKCHNIVVLISAALLCFLAGSCNRDSNRFDGHWKINLEKSGSIDPWFDLQLDIHGDGDHVTIVKRYFGGNRHDRRVDSMRVNTQGREEAAAVPPGRWLGEVSMGIYYGRQTNRHVTARKDDSHNALVLEMRETLETAQGDVTVELNETYTLSPDGSTMRLSENRSTRKSGPPLTYTFERSTR